MKIVFSHHVFYGYTSSFKTYLLSLCVWTFRPDYGKRRRPPRPAPLPSIPFPAVWCHPSRWSQHGNLPACLHRKDLQPVVAILPSRGPDKLPSSDRSRSRGKRLSCVHGETRDLCFKQEHDISRMLPSHVICTGSVSSTTSANFSTFLNLHFCLQHPR